MTFTMRLQIFFHGFSVSAVAHILTRQILLPSPIVYLAMLSGFVKFSSRQVLFEKTQAVWINISPTASTWAKNPQ